MSRASQRGQTPQRENRLPGIPGSAQKKFRHGRFRRVNVINSTSGNDDSLWESSSLQSSVFMDSVTDVFEDLLDQRNRIQRMQLEEKRFTSRLLTPPSVSGSYSPSRELLRQFVDDIHGNYLFFPFIPFIIIG